MRGRVSTIGEADWPEILMSALLRGLGTKQAAHELGVSADVVRAACRRHKMPLTKLQTSLARLRTAPRSDRPVHSPQAAQR